MIRDGSPRLEMDVGSSSTSSAASSRHSLAVF